MVTSSGVCRNVSFAATALSTCKSLIKLSPLSLNRKLSKEKLSAGDAVEEEVVEEAEEMDVGVEARVVDGEATAEAADEVKDVVVPLHLLAINLLLSCCTLLSKPITFPIHFYNSRAHVHEAVTLLAAFAGAPSQSKFGLTPGIIPPVYPTLCRRQD